jgi:transposase
LTGIGPSSAARLLADVGDIHRLADRDRFASWNGTAPLDASSGNQQRHRLSRASNRRINLASARTIAAGQAFVQNLRRGHYAITADLPAGDRIHVAFDELALML